MDLDTLLTLTDILLNFLRHLKIFVIRLDRVSYNFAWASALMEVLDSLVQCSHTTCSMVAKTGEYDWFASVPRMEGAPRFSGVPRILYPIADNSGLRGSAKNIAYALPFWCCTSADLLRVSTQPFWECQSGTNIEQKPGSNGKLRVRL